MFVVSTECIQCDHDSCEECDVRNCICFNRLEYVDDDHKVEFYFNRLDRGNFVIYKNTISVEDFDNKETYIEFSYENNIKIVTSANFGHSAFYVPARANDSLVKALKYIIQVSDLDEETKIKARDKIDTWCDQR